MLIVYMVRTKTDATETFKHLVEENLIPEAHTLPGCKLFGFYQNVTNEREFIFHELWDKEESLFTYKQNLRTYANPLA